MNRSALFVISRLHCMDGIASHLATMLPALRRHGWTPHMVVGFIDCPPENAGRLTSIKQACETFVEDARVDNRRGRSVFQIVREARTIAQHCKRAQVTVIHLRGRGLGPAAMLACLSCGCRTINVPPLATDASEQRSPWHRLSASVWGSLIGHRIIAISDEMQTVLRDQWRVPERRVRHVPHGVDLRKFRVVGPAARKEIRAKFGIPDEAFVLVQVARVGWIKRPDTVVDAVALLRRDNRPVHVLFVGYCVEPERHSLVAQAEQLGVSHEVHVVGQQDVPSMMGAADVKVLASEREGFGIAVIEAMASGVVPVRTPVEGAADQIDDGVNGLLFPVGDHEALADRLRFLMDHPDKRREMGEAAAKKAREKFSDDAMARGTIAVYEELLAERRNRGNGWFGRVLGRRAST